MTASIPYILGFLLAATVIVLSGSKLSKYGDMLADMLGWGKMFVGIILISAVTTMPELMTGFASVAIIDAPDLAVGNVLGSCAFNILILSILDLYYNPKKSLTSAAQTGHVVAAALGIMLLSMVALAIIMPGIFGSIGWIGGFTVSFLVLYVIALRVVFNFEHKQKAPAISKKEFPLSLKQTVIRFAIHAAIVMGAALALPYFGEYLAEASGLGQSFFGTLFIAGSTSLPEIVVCVAAIRLGTIDMALGNILGANIFNIGILAFIDIFYLKGPILLYTSSVHIIPVMGTIAITAIGIIGLVYKSDKKWKLAIDTAAILFVYIVMMALLFTRN
jgi:cation:H+ antiporter